MADPRSRRALTVLVVSAVGAVLALVGILFLGGDGDGADAEPTPTTAAGDPVAVDLVEVGTCFNDPGDEGTQQYTDLPVVGCDEPHDNEVYHLFDAPGGAAYPGDEEIAQVTEAGCYEAFEAYVGKPYEQSNLEILAVPPTQEVWESGDREVLCAVYDAERTELTGPVRGSAR